MALRASSVGSGRATRSSSVCQMRSMFSARRRSARRRSPSGLSSSSATLRSLVSTERRAASVGCAVKTGRTPRLPAVARRCSGSASFSMSAVRARMLPSAARRAASSRPRWTCSVTFARWKYVEKARTSLAAVARSVSPRSRAAASPSERVRARTCSTRSSSSFLLSDEGLAEQITEAADVGTQGDVVARAGFGAFDGHDLGRGVVGAAHRCGSLRRSGTSHVTHGWGRNGRRVGQV